MRRSAKPQSPRSIIDLTSTRLSLRQLGDTREIKIINIAHRKSLGVTIQSICLCWICKSMLYLCCLWEGLLKIICFKETLTCEIGFWFPLYGIHRLMGTCSTVRPRPFLAAQPRWVLESIVQWWFYYRREGRGLWPRHFLFRRFHLVSAILVIWPGDVIKSSTFGWDMTPCHHRTPTGCVIIKDYRNSIHSGAGFLRVTLILTTRVSLSLDQLESSCSSYSA